MKAPIDQKVIMVLKFGILKCIDITKQDIGSIQPSWAQEAIVGHLLINLHDILRILDRAGVRLDWCDDLPPDHDITHQVKIVRDAMCHIGSGRKDLDEFKNILSFGMCCGRGTLLQNGDTTLGNPYDDDQAIFMGKHRLLVRRHLHRCVNEADHLGPQITKRYGLFWPPF